MLAIVGLWIYRAIVQSNEKSIEFTWEHIQDSSETMSNMRAKVRLFAFEQDCAYQKPIFPGSRKCSVMVNVLWSLNIVQQISQKSCKSIYFYSFLQNQQPCTILHRVQHNKSNIIFSDVMCFLSLSQVFFFSVHRKASTFIHISRILQEADCSIWHQHML